MRPPGGRPERVLHGVSWDHPRGYAPLQGTVAAFEVATNSVVEWSKRSLREFGDAGIEELAARNDLVVIDHPWVGHAAATGCLAPLDEIIDPKVLAEIRIGAVGPSYESYNYQGHQWALPIDAAAQVCAYRPDLLTRVGGSVPHTWEEALDLVERLRRHGSAAAMPLNATDAFPALLSICANAGQDPFGGVDGAIDDEVVAIGLQRLRMLARCVDGRGLMENPPQLLDVMSTTDEVAYMPLTFGYSNYSRVGFRPNLVLFADIPSASRGAIGSTLGGAGIAVSSSTPDPTLAAGYVAWLASPTVQAGPYLEAGGQPSQRQAWDADDANELASGFFRSTLGTVDRAYLRPRYAGFVAFQIEAGRWIHEYLRSSADDERALAARLRDLQGESGKAIQPAGSRAL